MLIGWGLLLVLSLVMAISTFIPRTPQEMLSFGQGSGALILDFLFKIGVYDNETFRLTIVSAWWFKSLIILIGVFLLKAIFKLIKDYKTFTKSTKNNYSKLSYLYGGSETELKSFLIYNLKKSGYKVNYNLETITALKELSFNSSMLMIHIGLLLTLLGGMLSYSYYEKGNLNLPLGVKLSTQQIKGIDFNENLELEAVALWPSYYSLDEFDGSFNGLVKDYFANFKIYSRQGETSVVTSTSQNSKIGQYRFFLTDFGATGVIAIRNDDGKEFMDIFPVEYKQGSLMGSYITNDNIGISIIYNGVSGKEGKESFDYCIYEYTKNGWKTMTAGQQEIFKPILYKGKEYIFKDVNRVAQFTVIKANYVTFSIGLTLFFLGMIVFLFSRKISLKISLISPQQLLVEGWAMPDKHQLNKEINRISKQMGWEEI